MKITALDQGDGTSWQDCYINPAFVAYIFPLPETYTEYKHGARTAIGMSGGRIFAVAEDVDLITILMSCE